MILIMKVIKRSILCARNATLHLFHIFRIIYQLITKSSVIYLQYLHPQKTNGSASTSAISNLYFKIVKVFSFKPPKIFELPLDSTSDSNVNVKRHLWEMYQFEHITELVCMAENETRKNNISNSNRNYALEHSRLFQERPVEGSRYVRIDSYRNSINGILNEFEKPACTRLFAVAKAIMSLSHRNVVPERGFSISICCLFMKISLTRKLLLH